MNTFLLVSNVVLFPTVLIVGFLLWGTLRSLGLLSWRLDQLEVITPSRIGRDGLKVGNKALDFTLPNVASAADVQSESGAQLNGDVSLHDFTGRKVLLVFTQSGCGPCHAIAPELNRLHQKGEHHILVINNGEFDETRKWAAESGARFPVLAQEKWSVSKRYQVFATPFAFLIDEQGTIASKGIVHSRQHLTYVLGGASNRQKHELGKSESDSTTDRSVSGVQNNDGEVSLSSKELSHV